MNAVNLTSIEQLCQIQNQLIKVFEGIGKGKFISCSNVDYGTCSIENIQPCEETFLDGIRVIFKEPLSMKP